MREIFRERIITRSTKSCGLKKNYKGHGIVTYDYQYFVEPYNVFKKLKRKKVDYLLVGTCISTILGLCCSGGALFPDSILEEMLIFYASAQLNDVVEGEVEVPEGAYITKKCFKRMKSELSKKLK